MSSFHHCLIATQYPSYWLATSFTNFLWIAKQITYVSSHPFSGCIMVYSVCHWNLGCFWTFAITNNAAMNNIHFYKYICEKKFLELK